jgi:hypothetical protein
LIGTGRGVKIMTAGNLGRFAMSLRLAGLLLATVAMVQPVAAADMSLRSHRHKVVRAHHRHVTHVVVHHRHHIRTAYQLIGMNFLHNYGPGPWPGTVATYDGSLRANCYRNAAAYLGQDNRPHPCG